MVHARLASTRVWIGIYIDLDKWSIIIPQCFAKEIIILVMGIRVFFLPRPKTLFLERYYFHRRVSVCVCVCVCLCVYHSMNSKSSCPILMKFGRMMYYDKIQVPFEDEINRIDRTQTLPKRVVKIDIKATYLWISQ